MAEDKIYLSAKDISSFYCIPLRTIYERIKQKYYSIDELGNVCLDDVEKYLAQPIKRGRKFKNENN